MPCVVLYMLSSYSSSNIHLILKFYVGLKNIRAVPSAELKKIIIKKKKNGAMG